MASGGGAPAAEAVTCPICLSLLVQPVTPPCRHTVCLACFEASVEQASLCCSLCRMRLSVWIRRARKSGSLVDAALWSRLQRLFPDQVRARLEGGDAELSPAGLAPAPVRISQPGEIRQEFERELEAALHEERTLRARAEQASHQLIASLRGEEEARAAQEQSDAELARGVRRAQLNSPRAEEQDAISAELVPAYLAPAPVITQQLAMLSPSAASDRSSQSRPPARGPSITTAPVRGPMDVYIGQLTPRPGGKRPVSSEPRLPTPTAAPAAGSGKENCDPWTAAPSIGGSGDRNFSFGGSSRGRSEPEQPRVGPTGSRSSHRLQRHDGPAATAEASQALGTCPEDRLGVGSGPVKHCPAAPLPQSPGPRCAGDSPAVRGGGLDAARERLNMPDSEEEPLPPPSGGSDLLPGKRRLEECASGPSAKRAACGPGGGPDSCEQPAWACLAESGDWSALLAEQQEAERRLEQERADRQLAERLQQELSRPPQVDRRKGTEDAYRLRQPAGRQRRPRSQLSIQESLRRGHTRSSW